MSLLVYGLVVPVTALTVLLSGVYIVSGDSPADLVEQWTGDRHIAMLMPPHDPRIPRHPQREVEHIAPDPTPGENAAAQAGQGEGKPAEASHEAPHAEAAAGHESAAKAEHADSHAVAEGHGGESHGAENHAAAHSPGIEVPPPPPPMDEPQAPPGGDPLAAPSFAKLTTRSDLKALTAPYPLPELLKNSADGPIPIVAAGKEARIAYARPFDADKAKPRIAVVVVGLGLSREATESAIIKLPPDVTLSFSPYASGLDGWIRRARSAGHEVMLDLPMEPPNFPARDSGSLSILSSHTPLEVVSHLEALMGKATGYVGFAGTLHSPVAASAQWSTLLRTLRSHGLLYIGDGLAGVAESDAPPVASVSLVADDSAFRAAIDVRLARILAAAQRDHAAVAYVSPRPVTMERLQAWFESLPQKGVVLAPASAVVHPQPDELTHEEPTVLHFGAVDKAPEGKKGEKKEGGKEGEKKEGGKKEGGKEAKKEGGKHE